MTNKPAKIFYENIEDAIERNRKKIPEVHKNLSNAGVILHSQIHLFALKNQYLSFVQAYLLDQYREQK